MAGFFGLFDYSKPGPGVRKDEPEKKGVARYFDILGKRLWKLVSLNFLYLLFSIVPYLIMWVICNTAIILVMMLCGMQEKAIGTYMTDGGGTLAILLGVFVVYCVNGGGAAACGMANVIRKYVDDTHAWVWQDFWSSFKDNIIQSTVAFVIDCFAVFVLVFSFGIYNFPNGLITGALANGVILTFIRAVLLLVILIWGMMHVYIYPVITSFRFKLRDVYRNSFIMVLGKLPQTAAAFFLGIVIPLLTAFLTVVVPFFGLFIPAIVLAGTEYTRMFISYPLIKKYMRDPEEAKREARREALRRDIEADAGVFNDNRVKPK